MFAHPSAILAEDSKALKGANVSAHPSAVLAEDSEALKGADVSAHPSAILPEDSEALKGAAPAALAFAKPRKFVIASRVATWRSPVA
jgi:hypothetical protein